MAPRGNVSWRRPYTSIYNDNYRYGTNLYSDTLSGCQKKRPDSSLSFVSSTASKVADERPVSASLPPLSPVSEVPLSTYKGSIFENLMNSALYSSYARDLEEEIPELTTTKKKTTTTSSATATSSLERQPVSNPVEIQRPQSLYDDANLFLTNPKIVPSASSRLLDDDTKKKKKKVVTERVTETASSLKTTSSAPTTHSVVITTSSSNSAVNTPSQNGPNAAAHWKDQCINLQCQVDMLTQALGDMNNKLKGELSSVKGKIYTELTDLNLSLEQSSLQSNELQKTVKKQANQLLELQSAYDDVQRHLQDSLDEIAGCQRRSLTVRKEMDRLRAEVEETLQKSSSASRV